MRRSSTPSSRELTTTFDSISSCFQRQTAAAPFRPLARSHSAARLAASGRLGRRRRSSGRSGGSALQFDGAAGRLAGGVAGSGGDSARRGQVPPVRDCNPIEPAAGAAFASGGGGSRERTTINHRAAKKRPESGFPSANARARASAIINFQLIVYLLRNNNQHTHTRRLNFAGAKASDSRGRAEIGGEPS